MIKEELEEPFLYLPPRTNLNKIDYDSQPNEIFDDITSSVLAHPHR